MVQPTIEEKKPLMISEVLAHLNKQEELDFRANKVKDTLQQFPVLGPRKAKELKEKILALEVKRLKEEHVIKLVNLKPDTAQEVKSILQGALVTLKNEDVQKIADIIKTY